MRKLSIGVLVSGGGSNLQSIIDACASGYIDGEVALVISNNSSAFALERAKNANIPCFHVSSKTEGDEIKADQKILELMQEHQVDIIALAGYMKLLGAETLKIYSGRALNIHPALLPKFGGKGMYGMNVHRAVITAGETESGVSIHVVSSEYDRGKILAQAKVRVELNDTPEILAARVLEQEHKLYSETLRKIANGEIML